MTLTPVEGRPGEFRDSESGYIISIRDFRGSDRIIPFEGREVKSFALNPGESLALQKWSILMYPWPRVIYPSLTVELSIDNCTIAEGPLFSVAESLERSEDDDLRERLTIIEEKLGIAGAKSMEGVYPVTRLKYLLRGLHELKAEIKGPDEYFKPLQENLQIYALRLCGVFRVPVAR
jgi:hypothetical protein